MSIIELLRVYQLDVSNKFRLGVPADDGDAVDGVCVCERMWDCASIMGRVVLD